MPALTAVARTAAAPVPRIGFIYHPMGTIYDQWTPARDGTAVRDAAHPRAARAAARSAARRHRAEPQGRRVERRRQLSASTRRRGLAERRSRRRRHDRRRGSAPRTDGGPDRGPNDWKTDASSRPSRWRSNSPAPSGAMAARACSRAPCRGRTRRRRSRWNPTRGSCSSGSLGQGGSVDERRAERRSDASILDSVAEDAARLQQRLGVAGSR